MFVDNYTKGFFVAVDGPNGSGKTTLINAICKKLKTLGHSVYITKEPTNTQLGVFLRGFAEKREGISVACLVSSDRYEHIANEIIPELEKGKIVITDRYILSSLILQVMDGVSEEFVLNINSSTLKPDLQVAVFVDEDVLQSRLGERECLTRFERENKSESELFYMRKGIDILKKQDINMLEIFNNSDLEENVDKIISCIISGWRSS